MGWSLFTIGSLNLDLPAAFWARLCGGPDYVYTLADVRSQDALLANHLERIQTAANESTEEEFEAIFGDYAFIFEDSINGSSTELYPDGASKGLTKANAQEYITAYLRAYT